MLTTTACLVALLAQQSGQREYKAELGKPYLVGVIGRVSGSGERLEISQSRIVTLQSVRTALAFGTKMSTTVAAEGKKLVIMTATIKNPEKMKIYIGTSRSFAIRVYDLNLKAGDLSYYGAVGKDLGELPSTLAPGQSVDVVLVFQLPAVTQFLRFSIFYDEPMSKTDPHFDVTSKMPKPTSIFAKDNLTYVDTATVAAGQKFDLDGLDFVVRGVEKTADNGYKVKVDVTNPMLLPMKWGWQYAKASVKDGKGAETAYYPDFVVTSGGDWRGEVMAGKTVSGDYKFYPSGGEAPKSFTLQMNSTKRAVTVTGF